MKYINRETRNKIAQLLADEWKGWEGYRDKQEPHPKRGVNIKRRMAEIRMKELMELVRILNPKLIKKAKPTPATT